MSGYQIPRNSLAWLLAAQIAVIAPHVGRLPIWVLAVCFGCIAWRIMVFQGRWSYPGRWIKTVFVLGGTIGIPLGYHKVYGLEPAVALLVVAYVLKLLEMHHKRDAYIVVLLGYFVAMTEFLFSQTIPWTLYTLLAVAMITAGLVGLNQTSSHTRPWVTFRTAMLLLAQSVPLMLVLFVLFPRVPPLWTVPLPSDVARSGVSDSMSPGDIASLSRSSDLAFKVAFDGQVPPLNQLYWRGLVLTHYDGKTWTQEPGWQRSPWLNGRTKPDWSGLIERLGDKVSYTVILEPTHRHWLFSLTVPDLPGDDNIAMLRDYRLGYREVIRNKLRYRVTSDLDYRLGKDISSYWAYRATVLPDGIDPRTRQLAKELRAKSSSREDYINRVMAMYGDGGYAYTLNPPKLEGANTIDQFLFDSKRGFCEHFAGSFVFMMRAVDIPARVVIGYQGGEFNQFGDYVSVYQYNAHAWAEVWISGKGWVREDPTSIVAPARIDQGLEAAVQKEGSFLEDSPLSLLGRNSLWLADLRLQLNAIGYYWDSWVVGYSSESQLELVRGYFGDVDRSQVGMIMLGIFFTLLAVTGGVLLARRSNRPLPPLEREYLKFCAALDRAGLSRRMGEGPLDYAARIGRERPDLADAAGAVTSTWVELNYGAVGPGRDKPQDIARLKRAVRALRIKALA